MKNKNQISKVQLTIILTVMALGLVAGVHAIVEDRLAREETDRLIAEMRHETECLLAAGATLNVISMSEDPMTKTAAAYVFDKVRPDCKDFLRSIVADTAVFDRLPEYSDAVYRFANN